MLENTEISKNSTRACQIFISVIRVRVMVFNVNFNNISVILCWSLLLVEETGLPEKTTDLSQVSDKLYYIMLHRVRLGWTGFELATLVLMCTDWTGSCKSSYHTITTTKPLIGMRIMKRLRKQILLTIGLFICNYELFFMNSSEY